MFAGDVQGAVVQEHEVLAATERGGDEGARSVALCGLGIASHLLGNVDRAVELGREALRRAEQDRTHHLDRYPARLFLGRALQDGDQMADADRVLRQGLRRSCPAACSRSSPSTATSSRPPTRPLTSPSGSSPRPARPTGWT